MRGYFQVQFDSRQFPPQIPIIGLIDRNSGELFSKFDYYVLSALKVEWLRVSNYDWEEEFKEEDEKG